MPAPLRSEIKYSSSVNVGKVSFAGGALSESVIVLGLKRDAVVTAFLINSQNNAAVRNVDVNDDFFTCNFGQDPGACEIGYMIANAVT